MLFRVLLQLPATDSGIVQNFVPLSWGFWEIAGLATGFQVLVGISGSVGHALMFLRAEQLSLSFKVGKEKEKAKRRSKPLTCMKKREREKRCCDRGKGNHDKNDDK